MGNIQGGIFLSILALVRYRVNDIPVEFMKDQPNKRYAIFLFALYVFYNFLKHNGLLLKKNISGQHVFITGGAMGIGRQFALQFAKQKCKVTIADLNTEAGEKVVEEIKKFNKYVQMFKCDVTNVEQIKEVAEKCEAEFGPVDILINNAGIVTGKKLLDANEKGIKLTYDVNSVSHAYTVRQFLPGMLKRDKGHIVSIASIAGHVGVAGLADYCGSKFAAVGFDEGLRMELTNQKSKVKTTCICPYYINTGMFDGVKPGFIMNLLLPILGEQYVGKRVLNAVRQNETMVLIPYMLYLVVLFKAILPTSVYDQVVDMLGMNNSMDQFKGRAGQK